MSPRLAFAIDAAVQAGEATLRQFHLGTEVLSKEDSTPVTEADRTAESILRHLIESAYPGEAILGEEYGGDEGFADRWVLDPIDGTKSFICGVPLYATLVSYEVDGEPILGVARFPALNMTVYAAKGEGASCDGEPIRISRTSSLSEASLCCGGHRSMHEAGRTGGLLRLAERCRTTRTWGDAYGHCLVARGKVEAMIDPRVALWDISAVRCIVREAGGMFTDFDGGGQPRTEAISTNQALHSAVLEAFAH